MNNDSNMVTWDKTNTTVCDLSREEFSYPLNLGFVDTDPRKYFASNKIEFLKNCNDIHIWGNNIPY